MRLAISRIPPHDFPAVADPSAEYSLNEPALSEPIILGISPSGGPVEVVDAWLDRVGAIRWLPRASDAVVYARHHRVRALVCWALHSAPTGVEQIALVRAAGFDVESLLVVSDVSSALVRFASRNRAHIAVMPLDRDDLLAFEERVVRGDRERIDGAPAVRAHVARSVARTLGLDRTDGEILRLACENCSDYEIVSTLGVDADVIADLERRLRERTGRTSIRELALDLTIAAHEVSVSGHVPLSAPPYVLTALQRVTPQLGVDRRGISFPPEAEDGRSD